MSLNCRDCNDAGEHVRGGHAYCADCFQARFGTWPEVTTPEDKVERMVEARFTGEDRARVLSVLFDEPLSRIYTPLSKMREGNPLSEEDKARIRELGASGEMHHSTIAAEVGVSRQAVTGVLSAGRPKVVAS